MYGFVGEVDLEGDGMSSGAAATPPADVSYFCFPPLRSIKMKADQFLTRLTIDCPLLEDLHIGLGREATSYTWDEDQRGHSRARASTY